MYIRGGGGGINIAHGEVTWLVDMAFASLPPSSHHILSLETREETAIYSTRAINSRLGGGGLEKFEAGYEGEKKKEGRKLKK